jgi:predicted hydrocarbon binding protein
MVLPLKQVGDKNRITWITQPQFINQQLLERRQTAFNVAMGKLRETNKIETVMQTAEAFGRGLFSECIPSEKKEYLSIEEWIQPVVEHILNPMGTAVAFTDITENEVKSVIFKCPVVDNLQDSCNHCPFSYGFVRGLFRSAFPNGEVLMGNVMANGAPLCQFTFKRHPTKDDLHERERIKKKFIQLRKNHATQQP